MPNQMKYAEIPYVNKPVSRIFHGTLMPALQVGGDVNDMLDEMYSRGVTAFDTARAYAACEVSLGKWIEARNNREDIVVLSKGANDSPFGRRRVNEKEIRKDLKKSLGYLKTDYIDIYLLHRDDPDVPVGDIVQILNELHEEGSIHAFGGSNWSYERIEAANEYAYAHDLIPFAVSSPNFGLADQIQDPWGGGCVSISGPLHAKDREWYARNGLPVVAYSSLGRGLFSGRLTYENRANAFDYLDEFAMRGYASDENFERLRRCEELAAQKGVRVPQIAMAWICAQEINTFAVVCTSSSERMQQNIDALHIELTREEVGYLDLR